jgi:hypothetical protein
MNRCLPLLALSFACGSKQVIEDAQCEIEEQEMFNTCLNAGCSASYAQDLEGVDSCAASGGGSVVSVEAGGECAFTSSGSCYVLCSCPEGVTIDLGAEDTDMSGGSDDTAFALVYDRIAALEEDVVDLFEGMSATNSEANALEVRLAALEEASALADAAHEAQVSDLQAQLDTLSDEVQAATIIVSEYDVDCYTGASATTSAGTHLRPYTYYDMYGNTEENHCLLANIDPNDPPYYMSVYQVYDNTLTYPTYSRADSLARYGEDRPSAYRQSVNWGNDMDYVGYMNSLDLSNITSGGDVYASGAGAQTDNTIPGSPTYTNLTTRVVIIHDRAYTLP